jgi:hypothetical protein
LLAIIPKDDYIFLTQSRQYEICTLSIGFEAMVPKEGSDFDSESVIGWDEAPHLSSGKLIRVPES